MDLGLKVRDRLLHACEEEDFSLNNIDTYSGSMICLTAISIPDVAIFPRFYRLFCQSVLFGIKVLKLDIKLCHWYAYHVVPRKDGGSGNIPFQFIGFPVTLNISMSWHSY